MSGGVGDRQEVSCPVGNTSATGAARVQNPRRRFAVLTNWLWTHADRQGAIIYCLLFIYLARRYASPSNGNAVIRLYGAF